MYGYYRAGLILYECKFTNASMKKNTQGSVCAHNTLKCDLFELKSCSLCADVTLNNIKVGKSIGGAYDEITQRSERAQTVKNELK